LHLLGARSLRQQNIRLLQFFVLLGACRFGEGTHANMNSLGDGLARSTGPNENLVFAGIQPKDAIEVAGCAGWDVANKPVAVPNLQGSERWT